MTEVVHNPTCFTRRVSFNNLHPDVAALEELGHGHGSVSGSTSVSGIAGGLNGSASNLGNLDFGYGTALFNDISKAYTQYPRQKRKRLPDPPSKSILKNKTAFQQNLTNTTINYHEDLDYTDDNKVIHVDDEDPLNPSAAAAMTAGAAPRSRRKSYSDMSPEELIALDPQFQTTKSKTTDVDKFKFDSQKTYYLPSKRSSVSGPDLAIAARQSYPSSNENNYNSISLTVKHNDFDSFPVNRTLLTVISGRRHSWNSIDWLMGSPHGSPSNSETTNEQFLLDGDYLIVASLIPLKLIKEYHKRPGSKKVSVDEYLYKKCENLLNYISNNETLKRNNLKLKITVEFVTDNSNVESTPAYTRIPFGYKYMLQHLYTQYQPNILILGNKSSNLNFKYPIKIKKQLERDEYLIKLSSYAIKYSSVPVILVGNSTLYHNTTGILSYTNGQAGGGGAGAKPPKPSITFNDGYSPGATSSSGRESSSPSVEKSRSNSQASTVESIESTESYVGDQTEQVSEDLVDGRLAELIASPSEDRFKDMMSLVSDTSLEASKNYMNAINSKDDSLKVDSKIHSIYRAQTTGNGSSVGGVSRRRSADDATAQDRIYKVRSLISYNEDDELKNDKIRNKLKHQKSRQKSTGSIKSTKSTKSEPEKKKKSLWQKLGLKKS